METKITLKKGIKLNKPILIVGLPGIGNVGRLVAIHMIKELKAKRIATLHSPHLPHQVVMLKNGKLRLVNNRFYLASGKRNGSDIVILTGDAQAVSPEGQYEINSKISQFFVNSLDGKFIYSLGGYNKENALTKSPKVYANATSKEIIDKFRDKGLIFGESRGMIFGSMGMIVAIAKESGVDGICIMGESSMLEVDAASAKAVMGVMNSILNLKTDITKFDKLIEKTAAAINDMEKQLGNQQFPVGYPQTALQQKEQKPSYIR